MCNNLMYEILVIWNVLKPKQVSLAMEIIGYEILVIIMKVKFL